VRAGAPPFYSVKTVNRPPTSKDPADRRAVLVYLQDHPRESAASIARRFGHKQDTVSKWRRRLKAGKLTVDGPPGDRSTRTAKPARRTVSELPPDVRRELRRAVLTRLRFLASEESLTDPAQTKSAVVLGILIDKYPDILTFVEDRGDAAQSAALADAQVAAALGLEAGGGTRTEE